MEFEFTVEKKFIAKITESEIGKEKYFIIELKDDSNHILLKAIYNIKKDNLEIIKRNMNSITIKIGMRYLKNKIQNIINQMLVK